MKLRFFQRLNTRLSLIPLLLMLVFLTAIGFYFLGYGHFIKDFYKPYVINLSLEKKITIDSWLDSNIKDIEELSNLDIFRDNVLILTGNHPFIKSKKKISEAEANISALFEEKAASGKYQAISVLSKEGNVLLSSKGDLIGEDWSHKTLFKEAVSGIKSSIGLNADIKSGGSIDFMSALTDANRNVIAILYASLPLKELVDFLKIKDSLYKSEKIEIIDRNGNTLTKDGISSQNTNIQDENLFSYAVNLKNADMRLISTVDKSDALMPFNILLIAYLSLIGIIFVSIVWSAYLAKRLITKPISKLVDIVKSLPKGELNADFGGGYKGEILELKESLKNMVDELKIRESHLLENTRSQEKSRLKSMLYSKIAHELRHPLNSTINSAETILSRENNISEVNRENLWEILNISKNLLLLVDDLTISSMLEEGKLSISEEEFNMCELLKDIEDFGKKLIGKKEIELIVDCQDVFMNKAVYTDRQYLRQVIINLLINAIRSTEEGTITILCSEVLKYNKSHIEISIADTGKGIEAEMMNDVFEEFMIAPLTLSVSKRLTDALGGKIEFESKAGRGSVFTVTIPIKKNIHSEPTTKV